VRIDLPWIDTGWAAFCRSAWIFQSPRLQPNAWKFEEQKRGATMRYIEPKVLRNGVAVSLIRQVQNPWSNDKTCDMYLDGAVPFPAYCTINAYEADE